MNRTSDDSWENALFLPPSWPYSRHDVTAPHAHPRTNSFGYNARELDTLPVQIGCSKPALHIKSTTSVLEAVQYYSQFQVLRDVMLGEYAAATPHGSRPPSIGGGKLRGCYRRRRAARAARRRRRDRASPRPAHGAVGNESVRRASDSPDGRGSSAESASTAVSQDSGTSSGLNGSRVGARSPQSQERADAKYAAAGTVQWRRSRLDSSMVTTVLRLPLLLVVLAVIIAELAAYFLVRQLISACEGVFVWRGLLGQLLTRLRAAQSYDEYMRYAVLIDGELGVDLGDSDTGAKYYDAPLLSRVTESLHEARVLADEHREEAADASDEGDEGYRGGRVSAKDDARTAAVALCDILRQGALKANAGGWENRQVWSCAYSGTARVVVDYISEVVACVRSVQESPHLLPAEKLTFFRQVARQQGRTALCLSGGAAMGWKHLGVARCLLDEARLPRVISGTSAGSLVAALLGTHTDDELRQIIRPELAKYMTACQGSARERLARWWTKGYYFDAVGWAPRAQVFTRGTLTFLEAFERTGKLLNITCTPIGHRYSPPKLFNYITAPNVLIWSAVLASASVPGVMQPMVLLMKTRDGQIRPYTDSGALWRDGSLRNDIPSADLRAQLNVQFTVVSQVNPHISLFFYDCIGSVGQPAPRSSRSIWRGGFVLSVAERMLKMDVRKWLRVLRDFSLMPLILGQDWSYMWLQKFDGDVTILPKAQVSEHFRLLLDPTPESLAQSMRAGEVATWPKLRMIKTRQTVEDAITNGWVEAYYACARSSHAMRAMPPQQAMAVARAARTIDQSCPQDKQATLLDALGAMAPAAAEAENGADLQALFSVRTRSNSPVAACPAPSQARRLSWQSLRSTAAAPFVLAQPARASGLRAKKTPAHLAERELCSSCPPSVAEDVWTG